MKAPTVNFHYIASNMVFYPISPTIEIWTYENQEILVYACFSFSR